MNEDNLNAIDNDDPKETIAMLEHKIASILDLAKHWKERAKTAESREQEMITKALGKLDGYRDLCNKLFQMTLRAEAAEKEVKKMKDGLEDIQQRIDSMGFEEFNHLLDQAKNKLKSLEQEGDLMDKGFAFMRLKKTIAMLMTWDRYWELMEEANKD
jgi:vacuolar-type H+-ATPase subunit D/Vma8